jgi:DNA-binding MarR family transcriptional regulator
VRDRPGPSILFDFFRAAQHVRLLLADAMADCGLRPDEYAVYSVLVDHGPSSPTRMAEATGVPPTSMSNYVRAMVDRGHVERVRNARDGRSVVLSLTPSGRAAHRRANRAFKEANDRFLDGLRVAGATFDDVRATVRTVGDAADAASRDPRAGSMRRAG